MIHYLSEVKIQLSILFLFVKHGNHNWLPIMEGRGMSREIAAMCYRSSKALASSAGSSGDSSPCQIVQNWEKQSSLFAPASLSHSMQTTPRMTWSWQDSSLQLSTLKEVIRGCLNTTFCG
jgi:hypothetical protein